MHHNCLFHFGKKSIDLLYIHNNLACIHYNQIHRLNKYNCILFLHYNQDFHYLYHHIYSKIDNISRKSHYRIRRDQNYLKMHIQHIFCIYDLHFLQFHLLSNTKNSPLDYSNFFGLF